jgi:hypothetical protein
MNRTGGDGQAQYVDSSGSVRKVNRSDSPIEPPRRIGTGKYLDFGGNWTKIGRMKWVSDCTVDGKADQMHAQIQGARPFGMRGENGNALVGFAVLGGFSYPGGASIYHDPGSEGMVLIDMQQEKNFGGLLLLVGLFLVIAVAIAAALYMRGGKRKESFENSYDRAQKGPSNGEDWSGYYDKK